MVNNMCSLAGDMVLKCRRAICEQNGDNFSLTNFRFGVLIEIKKASLVTKLDYSESATHQLYLSCSQ